MSLQNLLSRLKVIDAIFAEESTKIRVSQVSAIAVIAEYKIRIFREGRKTDGSPIGQYSTIPYYQSPNSLVGVPSISPIGKNGSAIFKNGKRKKTRYLGGGYKELRELVGRQSGTVDLNLSGSLERSIQVVEENSIVRIRYTNEAEAEKMTGNEERFGAVISEVSEEENEIGQNAAREEVRFIFDELDA